ncbi:MAG TPA: LysR family transcriptional regulator [Trinickia sp.]|nr:LysR family transcriptional regulator [Trinickia sp.]
MQLDSHNLNDLMYFAQVVEHGGFSAAERVLGISKSRLSRRVAELEASLGVRLLQRSTRKLALTEAGQLFYRHCQAMLLEAQLAMNAVQELRSSPRGNVRVSVPVTVSQTLLTEILPEFLLRYPEVRVAVRVTNRVIDLYEDSVDVALRVRSEPPDSANIVVRPLWRTEQMLVGSPTLLSQHAPPLLPGDLARFETLDAPSADGRHVFHLIAPDGTRFIHEHEPRVVTADLSTIREAVLAGVGIAALPEMMYGAAMRAGQLSPVMPGWTLPAPQLFAVFISRQGMAPAVRAFVDYLVEVLDRGKLNPLECPTRDQVRAAQALSAAT